MAFGTIGVAKQKGGSVGSSGHHNDRTRETPNADPERTHLNLVLVGDDRNAAEQVREIIEEHGGRPRRDSVEAVELLLSASHEYFEERAGEISQERVDRFVEQATKFLGDRRNCGVCVKAVLHMDERTPHIHAHMVPISPEGRLSAYHYLDGRQKMKELHDRYAEYMKPLGLERGREDSRARHQTVKKFYASIEQEVEFKLDHTLVPDPSRMFLTADGVKKYKEQVFKAILEQLKVPIQTLQHQAMLAKDERAHRVETERRADERAAAVETRARKQVAAIERQAAERYSILECSAKAILDENKDLRVENDQLRMERNKLGHALLTENLQKRELYKLASERGERLTDIPMLEVMSKLGYEGEHREHAHVYLSAEGRVALSISDNKAYDHDGQLVCTNSFRLVMHIVNVHDGEQFSREQTFDWLVENFGEKRAGAAYLVEREHTAFETFARQREEREMERGSPAVERQPGIEPEIADHDRSDDRGGGGFER